MTICYLPDSSADGIFPIPGWAPGRAEEPMWTRPSTTYLSHLSMGFLPYLAENLDEQRYLGQGYSECLSVISPSQGGICSLLFQVFRESIQDSSWEEAWWEHLHSGHLSKYTVARPHLYAPYHVWSDIKSLCASTCHEKQGSMTSTHNSGYHSESWLALESGQTILKKFTKPNCFSGCWTSSHILGLCSIESY